MNLRKSVLTVAALFCGLSLSQKTTVCSIYEDLSVDKKNAGNDGRVNSLVLEYFKSELATHSGISVTLPEPTTSAVEKSGMKTGAPLTESQVKTVCAMTKSSVFCAVSLVNDPAAQGKKVAKVRLFNNSGKFIKEVSYKFSDVKEADFISIKLAQDAAKYIRGEKDVDKINEKRATVLVGHKMIQVPADQKPAQPVKPAVKPANK